MSKNSKGFRHSVAEYRRILQELKQGRFSPLYLLMGEEPYFIDRLSGYLAEHVLEESQKSFNLTVLYGRDTTAGDVIAACRRFPMMAERQVVVLKEAQQLRGIDQLAHYAQAPLGSTLFVLCHKGKALDRRSVLYKKIAGAGVVFESVPARDYEMPDWVLSLFKERGLTIDMKAVSMIVEKLGTDLSKLENETDKLLTGLPEGTRRVTERDVELHIGISKDFNNFELTKALSEKDAVKAMRIADHFAQNPKDNPLVVTIQALFTHFLRIFVMGYLRWTAQKARTPLPSDTELMKRLKLSSTYFVKEYFNAAALYPTRKSFTALGLIRQYDMKGKGMDAGSADNGELLKELILKLLSL